MTSKPLRKAELTASSELATLSKQRLRLWVRLLRTTRMIENEVREHLRTKFDITLPRFDVMATLERSGAGLRMSELSQELMVSNGNVTGIVDRLVNDGLVERIAIVGDRRSTQVRLTTAGQDLFATLAASHEALVNRLFDGLGYENAVAIISRLGVVDDHGVDNEHINGERANDKQDSQSVRNNQK